MKAAMTKAEVSFSVTAVDAEAIRKIVARAVRLGMLRNASKALKANITRLWLDMDLTAVHANGCRLNLQALLVADDFNFAHDIYGILRHLDRTTGQLMDCFVPRFAVRES